MLVTKTIQIEFANSNYNAVDCIKDLRAATESASLNLFSKYEVRLEMPRVMNGYQVVMDVRIPEEIVDDFSIGNHLRGVSAYLLKYCDGRYDDAVVGKRLLNYTVIPETVETSFSYSFSERLSLIAAVAELMKNDDEQTTLKIRKIQEIIRDQEVNYYV